MRSVCRHRAAEPELLAHHFTQAGRPKPLSNGGARRDSVRWRDTRLLKAQSSSNWRLPNRDLADNAGFAARKIKLEVAFANALALTGDPVGGKVHYDWALAVYDPAEHGAVTTRLAGMLG